MAITLVRTRWRNQSNIVFNAANSQQKGALWGGSGDKMPCVRVAPGGWPLSNRWYLPAERAKRGTTGELAIRLVAEGDPNSVSLLGNKSH